MTSTNTDILPLTILNTQVEGTPDLVDRVSTLLRDAGGTVVETAVIYQGHAYKAIKTDIEGDLLELLARVVDEEAQCLRSGRLMWGYCGPMTNNVQIDTRKAGRFIAALTGAAGRVDNVVTKNLSTTFRTDRSYHTITQLGNLQDCHPIVNAVIGRFGVRS